MKTVRIAVIGVGNIGTVHALQIGQGHIAGMQLVACCDIEPQRQEFITTVLPGVPVYSDYRQVVTRPDVDGVVIAVPHPLHEEVAIAAFEAGKHVLVEKPISVSVSAAQRINEAAIKARTVFGIMLNQRTNPLFIKARQLVHGGHLGQIKRSVWLVTNWYRTQAYYDSGIWRATWSGEGGGVLLNQAPHNLDLWQWICGMPATVTGYCDIARHHNIETEDDATIFTRYKNGATGIFIVSTGEYPGTNRLEISGTLGKIVLEDRTLKWWRLDQSYEEVQEHTEEAFLDIPMTYQEFTQEQTEPGHAAILQNFTDSILYGTPLLAPGSEGILELAISNAAYLSAWKDNMPIDLPLNGAEFDALLGKRIGNPTAKAEKQNCSNHNDYVKRWNTNW